MKRQTNVVKYFKVQDFLTTTNTRNHEIAIRYLIAEKWNVASAVTSYYGDFK